MVKLNIVNSTLNTPNTLNNNGNSYSVIIMYLLVLFLIIGGFIFFRKYLLKRIGNVRNGSHMKIIDRLIISQDKQIILIDMKSRILVVGITQQKMETLASFDKDEEDEEFKEFKDFGNNEIDENNKNNGFFEVLNEKFKAGFNKFNDKNKNEKDEKDKK